MRKITQFFFQLVRCENHSDLERHLHDILGKLTYIMRTNPSQEAINRLTIVYKVDWTNKGYYCRQGGATAYIYANIYLVSICS